MADTTIELSFFRKINKNRHNHGIIPLLSTVRKRKYFNKEMYSRHKIIKKIQAIFI